MFLRIVAGVLTLGTTACVPDSDDHRVPKSPRGRTVDLELRVVCSPSAGRLVHGERGLVELRVVNRSSREVAVPFEIMRLGKGRSDRSAEPSYRAEGQFLAGFASPVIECRFEDLAGTVVAATDLIGLSDIPALKPGGYVSRSFLVRAPSRPGIYRLVVVVDTTPLDTSPGTNTWSKGPPNVYIRQEVVHESIPVD